MMRRRSAVVSLVIAVVLIAGTLIFARGGSAASDTGYTPGWVAVAAGEVLTINVFNTSGKQVSATISIENASAGWFDTGPTFMALDPAQVGGIGYSCSTGTCTGLPVVAAPKKSVIPSAQWEAGTGQIYVGGGQWMSFKD